MGVGGGWWTSQSAAEGQTLFSVLPGCALLREVYLQSSPRYQIHLRCSYPNFLFSELILSFCQGYPCRKCCQKILEHSHPGHFPFLGLGYYHFLLTSDSQTPGASESPGGWLKTNWWTHPTRVCISNKLRMTLMLWPRTTALDTQQQVRSNLFSEKWYPHMSARQQDASEFYLSFPLNLDSFISFWVRAAITVPWAIPKDTCHQLHQLQVISTHTSLSQKQTGNSSHNT